MALFPGLFLNDAFGNCRVIAVPGRLLADLGDDACASEGDLVGEASGICEEMVAL